MVRELAEIPVRARSRAVQLVGADVLQQVTELVERACEDIERG